MIPGKDWLRRLSFKRKIAVVVMVSCTFALLVTCFAFIVHELRGFRSNMVKQLASLGDVIGVNSTAALSFVDQEAASENLSSLRAQAHVVCARIFDARGEVFGAYDRGEEDCTVDGPQEGQRFGAGTLDVFRSVELDGSPMGTVFIRSDTNEIRKATIDFVELTGGVLVLAIVAAMFSASVCQKLVTDPVLRLAEAARHVTEREDYSVRVPKETNDELGLLTDAFNVMLTQIHARDQALHQANDGLERRVHERTAELESAKEISRKLKDLEGLKSDFLATASHELRTPLTIIREYVSLVLDGVVGSISGEQEECLDGALRNCDRLGNLIDAILDLERIETGKSKVERRELSLPPLLENCVRDFSPSCEKKDQSLEMEVEEALPPILASRGKIVQVIVNLIGNAQKFTPEGGRIIVRAFMDEPDAAHVVIEVEDNGMGISEADQALVFDRFGQIGRQDGPGAKGTGLGLAIAKNIIELHGGEMRLQSTPGEGSTFSFTVPIYTDISAMGALATDALRAARASGNCLNVILIRMDTNPTDREEPKPTLPKIDECVHSTLRLTDDSTLVLEKKNIIIVVAEVKEGVTRSLPHRIEEALLREFGAHTPLRLAAGILSEEESVDEWLQALKEQSAPLGATSLRKNVLIIDDDEANLRLLSGVLERSALPVQVSCATDGYDGCAQFTQPGPELVLLDLNMSGLSGEQVLDRIKKNRNWQTTKVMILTGNRASLPRLTRLGADACLTTPFDPAELVETAGALLGEKLSSSGKPSLAHP